MNNLGMISYRLGDFSTAWELSELAIQLCRKIELWGGEAAGLSNLGLLAFQKGQLEKAVEYQTKALEISHTHKLTKIEALVAARLGRIYLTMGDDTEAEKLFDQALYLRGNEDRPGLTLEPLAGLAELNLRRGDIGVARKFAEQTRQLLAQLDPLPLDDIDDPIWIYLVCYQVFIAAGDLQAHLWLESGHQLLMGLAGKIPSKGDQESFLSAFTSHRQIIETRVE